MSLDYSPLANAIAQLEKSLAYANSPAALADAGLREQLRNSVIQCFDFTYELSWKMLKRYLEETDAFDTSDLTIRVDVVDWAATSETFRKIITQDKVVVQDLPRC